MLILIVFIEHACNLCRHKERENKNEYIYIYIYIYLFEDRHTYIYIHFSTKIMSSIHIFLLKPKISS